VSKKTAKPIRKVSSTKKHCFVITLYFLNRPHMKFWCKNWHQWTITLTPKQHLPCWSQASTLYQPI